MEIDDEVFERLNDINDEMLELCGWVKQRMDFDTAEKLVPIVDRLTRLVAELSVGKE